MVYVTGTPGETLVVPSLLEMLKSAVEVVTATVSTSVEVLLVAFTSTTPAGVVTVAVLVIAVPGGALTVAVTVYVSAEPIGNFTVCLIFPGPEVARVAPPLGVAVTFT